MGVKERYEAKYGVKGRYLQKHYADLDLDRVDQAYIDAFVNDANAYLSSAEKDYGALTYGTSADAYNSRNTTWQDLDTRARTIEGWLAKNRNAIGEDAYKSLSGSLGSYRNGGKSVLDSFKGAADFYTQFESEDAYNEWNRLQELANSENASAGWERYLSDSNNIDDKKSNNRYLGFGDSFWGLRNYEKVKDSVYTQPNYNGDWSEDEKKIFGALYYSSPEEAYQYASDLNEGKRVSAVANRIDGTVLEPLFSALAGFDNAISGFGNIANFITGEKGADPTGLALINATMRENDKGLWKVTNDLTYTTGNMLPSILVGTATGGVGGAVSMGVSAGGNAYAEMRNLGYNEWQARGYGALVGASETVLQSLIGGIGKLGGIFTGNAISKMIAKLDNAIARTAIHLGGNMVSEGLEEAIQTVLEPAFKALMTGEDFESPEWEEVWYSALLGALSAGTLEGAPTIAQTIMNSHRANQAYSADPTALVDEALEIDPNNAHAQRMQERLDSGKKLSGYQLNRLATANAQALHAQNTDKMTDAVMKRLTELGETGDVSKLAKAIVKGASGEKLSLAEKSAIKNSKYGTDLYNAFTKQKATGKAQASSATENPTEKEKATAAKFSASADGVTKLGDTEVSIKEISAVKNGEVILRLEDGSTVNARDLTFSSEAEALLYENVINMGLNTVSAQAFLENYNPSTSLSDYVLGFREAYRAGELGIPKTELSTGFAARLSEKQKHLAYSLGKIDAKYRNSNTTTKKESVKNEQEGVRLRDGGERHRGADPDGQVSAMESSTGQDQGRKTDSKPKDSRAASLSYGNAVSAKSLGITGGLDIGKAKRITEDNETPAMAKARKRAEARGLKVTFFAGDNLYVSVGGETISSRGYIEGHEVFIRVDHPVYTADQLMRHEIGHDRIARGEVNVNDLRERIKNRFGEENVVMIANAYAEAYEGSDMSADEIWEEIICDSLGDMNIFAPVELLGEMNSEFLSNLKEEVKKDAKSERGPPTNKGKASQEIYPKKVKYALDDSDVDNSTELRYNEKNNDLGGQNGRKESQNTEVLGRRAVSATHRGRDGVWKQGYDPEEVYQRLANSQNGKGRSGKARSGHSGWLGKGRGNSPDVLRFGKSLLGDLRGRQLSGVDTAGRSLPADVKKAFAESIFKNEKGDLLSLYHWTDAEFSIFSKGDIGFHLGTIDAAHKRYQDVEKKRHLDRSFYKECYVNLKKPAIIAYDPMRWDVFPTAHKLNQQGILSDAELNKLGAMDGYMQTNYDSPAAKELQKMLSAKGFDGIVYTNNHEGELSVVVFYPDQIYTVAENGIDLDYRADASEGGKRFALDVDSKGTHLTEAQQEFFKDSKIRDSMGRLLVVYHGTPNGKFYEFSYDKAGLVGGSQHGYGFYFSESERDAKLYAQGIGTSLSLYMDQHETTRRACIGLTHVDTCAVR